jgi:hypothetical protein
MEVPRAMERGLCKQQQTEPHRKEQHKVKRGFKVTANEVSSFRRARKIERKLSRRYLGESDHFMRQVLLEILNNPQITLFRPTIHHGMARSRIVEGGDGLLLWRIAANIINK